MYLNQKKKGYGWYATVNKDKKGDKVADEEVKYLSFDFAKGTEPILQDLTEHGSYEGELIFRDKTGAERKVFPFIDDYFHEVKFKVLKKENEYKDPDPVMRPTTDPKWDMSEKTYQPTLDGKPDEAYWKMRTDEITDDDLPFL